MTNTQFLKAIAIIVKYHSTKMVINYVKPNGSVGTVLEQPTIHIIDCCAGLTEELINNGFFLSVGNGMVSVSHFG